MRTWYDPAGGRSLRGSSVRMRPAAAVETREDFRQVSYARLACFATIPGEGLQGSAPALELLRERLEK